MPGSFNVSEMLGQTQNKAIISNNQVFMPYSSTAITKALSDYATKYLNETEETKEKGIKELREFAKNEFNLLMTNSDDVYLLCYLRSRKFDPKRAANLMKKGMEFAKSNRQLFGQNDSPSVRATMEARIIGFLPYRDSKGRALIFIRAENWDPDVLPAEKVIFSSMVTLQTAVDNPVNQIAGFVVLFDLKNLKVQQIIAISNWLIFGIQALQRCCPCLVKEFHIINTPSIFRGAWKMVKPLLSEKIRRRIHFYKPSDAESLHCQIPPEILPSELNGKLGPFSNDHWASDLPAIEKIYHQRVRKFLDNKKIDSSSLR